MSPFKFVFYNYLIFRDGQIVANSFRIWITFFRNEFLLYYLFTILGSSSRYGNIVAFSFELITNLKGKFRRVYYIFVNCYYHQYSWAKWHHILIPRRPGINTSSSTVYGTRLQTRLVLDCWLQHCCIPAKHAPPDPLSQTGCLICKFSFG